MKIFHLKKELPHATTFSFAMWQSLKNHWKQQVNTPDQNTVRINETSPVLIAKPSHVQTLMIDIVGGGVSSFIASGLAGNFSWKALLGGKSVATSTALSSFQIGIIAGVIVYLGKYSYQHRHHLTSLVQQLRKSSPHT